MSVIHGLILKTCLLRSSREFVILTEENKNDQQGALLTYCLQLKFGIKTFLVRWGATCDFLLSLFFSVGYEKVVLNSHNLSAQMKV